MVNMKVVVMAFAMILMLAGMPASVQAQSETGLVGEWHFDGDAKDSSGNGNDGTVYGATFVEGEVGKALSFDGSNDYVEVPNRDILKSQNSLTVSAWIKVEAPSSSSTIYFITTNGFGVWKQKDQMGLAIDLPETNSSGGQIKTNTWQKIIGTYDGTWIKFYVNGELKGITNWPGRISFGGSRNTVIFGAFNGVYWNGIIDEVCIYNRALSADEIKELYEGEQTALSITKSASPYSIKQGQTTTITLTIKNTGTTDITNIEVMDSIHRNFDLIGGDFPNPRKFDIIGKGESREIQYMIKAKEGGTFNLDPASGIYADKDGNIQEAKSEPFSVKVITYFEPTPAKTSAPASTPEPTTNPVKTASVSLYGEKTDVVLGEDILLKLSAVNLITKPMMHVQVIIIPPSGMSVTSSEFSKIAAGQFTANYELPPGDGRDIEVSIRSNQIGDFNVNGRIIYYFGDEKGTAEDHNLNLPIKVRKEPGLTVSSDSGANNGGTTSKTPGFALVIGIVGFAVASFLIKKSRF